MDCYVWLAVRCELKCVGRTGGAIPKVSEVSFQVGVPLIEGVEVEDMVMVGLAEGDGESPVGIIVIVQEEDCSGPV